MPERPASRARFLARLIATAALAAALVALLDGVVIVLSGQAALGAGQTLRLVFSLAALALVPGLLLGLVEVVLAGGLAGVRLGAWRRALREDGSRDRATAAWIISGVLAAGALAAALAWTGPRLFTLPDDAPARQGALALRGLVLGALALGMLAGLGLAAWSGARGLRGLLERLPDRWRERLPFTWSALILCALVALVTGLWLLLPYSELFLLMDLRLWGWGVLLLALQGALLWGWAHRTARRVGRRRRWGVLVAIALAASVPVSVFTFDDPQLLSVTLREATVGRRLVRGWRWALDLDGDGYSALLGGGDCDDSNPAIHVGAFDRGGNGVDENCDGADAPLVATSEYPKNTHGRRHTGTSLLLITVDALRADHLGVAGYSRPTTPVLDAFARKGVVFEHAYSPGNHTAQSIPALLTGRYPSRIRWARYSNYPPLGTGVPTVAEALRAAGYRAVGIFPHWYFDRVRNLHHGFDVWDLSAAAPKDNGGATTAPALTRLAVRRLRRLVGTAAPFFLWVHYYEPHHPYVAHPGVTSFGTGRIDRYDGEIRFADEQIGRLLGELESLGAMSRTAVVVTGDHGEAFGEHRRFYHGHQVYDEEVHVPLLLRAPGLTPGRVKVPVSLVDVVPTLLELGGVDQPSGLSGQSLLSLARGQVAQSRPIFVELLAHPHVPHTSRAVILDGFKLIHDLGENRFELYDLSHDPGETRDLFSSRPREAARLRTVLARFAGGALPSSPAASPTSPRARHER